MSVLKGDDGLASKKKLSHKQVKRAKKRDAKLKNKEIRIKNDADNSNSGMYSTAICMFPMISEIKFSAIN